MALLWPLIMAFWIPWAVGKRLFFTPCRTCCGITCLGEEEWNKTPDVDVDLERGDSGTPVEADVQSAPPTICPASTTDSASTATPPFNEDIQESLSENILPTYEQVTKPAFPTRA